MSRPCRAGGVLGRYYVVHTEEGQVEIAAWEQEPPDLAEEVRLAPVVPTVVFVTAPVSLADGNEHEQTVHS